ncbi:hypothetical protein KJ966_08885 [bacterium]|nr:hypothetical protein [bacterium]
MKNEKPTSEKMIPESFTLSKFEPPYPGFFETPFPAQKPLSAKISNPYLSVWHQLKENGSSFPDEVYFFHPIKFIEHLKTISEVSTIKFYNYNFPCTIQPIVNDVNSDVLPVDTKCKHQINGYSRYGGKLKLKINGRKKTFIENLREIPKDNKEELKIAFGEMKNTKSTIAQPNLTTASWDPASYAMNYGSGTSQINQVDSQSDTQQYPDWTKSNWDFGEYQDKYGMKKDELVLFEIKKPIPGLSLDKVYEFDNISDEAQLHIINESIQYFEKNLGIIDVNADTKFSTVIDELNDRPVSYEETKDLREILGDLVHLSHKWLKATKSGVAISIDIFRDKEVWKLIKEDYKTGFLKKGSFKYDAAHGTIKLTFEGNRNFRMKISKLAKKTTRLKAKSWMTIDYIASKSGYAKSSLAKKIAPRGNVISFFICGAINAAKFFEDEEYTLSDLAVDLGMDALKIVVGGLLAGLFVGAALASAPVWVVVGGAIVVGAIIGTTLDAVDNFLGLSDAIKKGIKEWLDTDLDYVPIEGELVGDWYSDI